MLQTALARAKVNLTLHVTGQREDGYHLLDSLVVFPEIGDFLEAEPGQGVSLTLGGAYGRDLDAGAENLVTRAAEALRGPGQGAALHLTKSLPVAAGIGGGSADAAAALRLLSELWDRPVDADLALSLGADVPVCLDGRHARMEGIGERITPIALPPFWLLLVNSGTPVATGVVFNALNSKNNPPMPENLPTWRDTSDLAAWLAEMRNDLEQPACSVDPALGDLIAALAATPGCLLARMSGSGGTCFGLFAEQETALAAQAALMPHGWWTAAGPVKP